MNVGLQSTWNCHYLRNELKVSMNNSSKVNYYEANNCGHSCWRPRNFTTSYTANEANLSESDVFWSDTHYLEYLIKISIPHGLPNDKRHEYVREKLESVYLNIIANTWKHKCCIRKDVNLGKGVLDLYTLATGPPKYSQIPLICTTRHEAATRHIAARVRFHCDTQQVLRTTLSVVHLDLSTLEPYMECTYSNIGVKYRFVSPYNSTRSETDSVWGGTTSRYLGDMELAADYQELTEGVVVISVCYGENQEWDTNNIIATTEVSVKDFVYVSTSECLHENSLCKIWFHELILQSSLDNIYLVSGGAEKLTYRGCLWPSLWADSQY